MSYKIIDLPDLGRVFNATDIMEVSANGLGSYKVNIGDFTLGGENYIFVNSNGTPTENGQAVKDAYVAAQAMTPNGAVLSATNRVVILLAPGLYDFDEDTYGPFQVNTSFIDFQSLSGERDVYFSSIDVVSYPAGIDARFSGIDTTVNSYYAHKAFAICTSGTVNENIIAKNCKGGSYSFSSFSSGFVGLYEDCEAQDNSFVSAGNGLAAPTGVTSSGSPNITNYGTIKNCKAWDGSFCSSNIFGLSSYVSNYGTIDNCESLYGYSFCFSPYSATNNGVISYCRSASYDSFVAVDYDGIGSGGAINNGAIVSCVTSGQNSFVMYLGDFNSPYAASNGGKIINCQVLGGGNSFAVHPAIVGGVNTNVISNCYMNTSAGFCGDIGINAGLINECIAQSSAFCNTSPGNILADILRCTLRGDSWTTGATGGGRVVLGIDSTGVINF